MDRITKSFLEQFASSNGLASIEQDKQFEHFVASLVIGKHYSESFSSSDVVIGGSGDGGIDGVGIIVNGALVTDEDDINELLDTNNSLEVVFVLSQARRSSSFSGQEITDFAFGVRDLFSESPSIRASSELEETRCIVNKLYDNSSKFNANPKCYLYYAATGTWVDDQDLVARMESGQADLLSTNLFSDVRFTCLGANELQTYFRDSKNSISRTILFPKRTTLPTLEGVEQAFIGILEWKEFRKLIETEEGDICASVFYDNVRHWQGFNEVNKEISDTLVDETMRCYLPLLNNGVTIVADSMRPTGDELHVEDYQIVNGCQTSHVLHSARKQLEDSVSIPVRLVATTENNVRDAIIRATNRQTQVANDQFVALAEFPRKLEDYFATFTSTKSLYYERRSRQYAADDKVEKVRVIDMKSMVRAFASCFLDMPHRTTKNYKGLVKLIGDRMFIQNHRLEMYYVAAFAHYRLEYLFRSQKIPREYKPARYHLLMCFRYLAQPIRLPRAWNSRDMERYCKPLMELLWNEEEYPKVFSKARQMIDDISKGNLHRDNIRREEVTTGLLQSFTD